LGLAMGCLLGYSMFESYLTGYIVFYAITYVVVLALTPFGYRTTFILVTLALGARFFGDHVTPFFAVFDDEEGYAWMAQNVASALHKQGPDPWSHNSWANVIGLLYYFFGVSHHVVKALNAFLGVIAAFMLCRVSYRLYGDYRVSRLVLYLGLFLPPLIFLSSITLKEQLISFLLVLILFGIVEKKWYGWNLAAVGVILLIQFRFDLVLCVLSLISFFWVWRYCYHSRVPRLVRPVALTICSLLLAGLGFMALEIESVQQSNVVQILSEADQSGNNSLRQSGSDSLRLNSARFVKYLDVEHPLAFRNLVLSPIRSVYSPSPFRPLKSPSRYVVFEALVISLWWYIAVPYTLLGIVMSGKHSERWLAVGFFLMVFLFSSYTILTFAPETFRYRWAGLPFFFMIAAYGWFSGCKRWRNKIIMLWWGSVAIFLSLYF